MRRGGHASRRLLQGGTESLPSPRCKAPVRIEGDNRTRKGRLTGERGGDGLSGAVPLELQRELRGGGARLAVRVLRAAALIAHPGDLYRRDGRYQASVGGGAYVSVLYLLALVCLRCTSARGLFGSGDHVWPRPHLEPAALHRRHRDRRCVRRGAAGRQRRALRPVRLHRGPRHAARCAGVGRPGLPGHRIELAQLQACSASTRTRTTFETTDLLPEHARRAVRMAAG